LITRERSRNTGPPDILPGVSLPEHPYEKIYPKKIKASALILTITLICSFAAVFIIYQSEAGSLSIQDRSTGLFILLLAWLITTGLISKWAYGRFSFGFGGGVDRPELDDEK
jgi:hypothetical protein